MSTLDQDYAAQRFNDFIQGLTTPRSLMENPALAQSEADALVSILIRNMPSKGAREWIEKVCMWLRENMEYRTWPTGKELTKACRECRPEPTRYRDETGANAGPSEAERYAAKMNSGDKEMGAVPVSCLYGYLAAEIEARGLVCLAGKPHDPPGKEEPVKATKRRRASASRPSTETAQQ